MMFENQKTINLELEKEVLSMADLIEVLRTKHLKDKEEMFI